MAVAGCLLVLNNFLGVCSGSFRCDILSCDNDNGAIDVAVTSRQAHSTFLILKNNDIIHKKETATQLKTNLHKIYSVIVATRGVAKTPQSEPLTL